MMSSLPGPRGGRREERTAPRTAPRARPRRPLPSPRVGAGGGQDGSQAVWLRLLPAALCPSVHAARAEAARGVAHPAPPRGESAAPKCRKPVGLSGGLIFPLDLRTFGPPGVSRCAPGVGRGGPWGRTGRLASDSCFPPWRCNQLGKRPRTRSPVPTTEAGLLHPETPLRLAFICFNLLHPPPAKEATGLLFPPSAPLGQERVSKLSQTQDAACSPGPLEWLGSVHRTKP